MKASSYIKRFFCQGALIYTVLSALLALSFVSSDDNGAMLILEPARQLYLLLFSYLLSLADTLFSAKQINQIVRHIAHPVLYLGAFALCILLPTGMEDNWFWTLFGVFTLAYIAVRVIIFLIMRKAKVQKENAKRPANFQRAQENVKKTALKDEKKPCRKKKDEYHSLFSDKQ